MSNIINSLINDEAGFIISAELALVLTIVVIGVIVGLSEVAKAVNTEYNGRAGDPGGRHKPDKVLPSTLGYQRSTWAGNPSNPYVTTRSASLGSAKAARSRRAVSRPVVARRR